MSNPEHKEKIFDDILNKLILLNLIDSIEILANIMLALSIMHIQGKTDEIPVNWDEAFKFITNASKKEKESLPVALGKQALTMNMWIQSMKNN